MAFINVTVVLAKHIIAYSRSSMKFKEDFVHVRKIPNENKKPAVI